MRKVNNCIQHSVNNEILSLIKSNRLTEKDIKTILKGFEDLYEDKKWENFIFILYVGEKIKLIENGCIELEIQSQYFVIENRELKKLIKHNKYILEMLKGRLKSLKE